MSTGDRYSIGEVAAMLGISPHTIRAWERRYGVLTPERTATRQRRYTPEDIELLQDVKRAADSTGVSLKLAFRASSRGGASGLRVAARPRAHPPQPPDPADNSERWSAVSELVSEPIFMLDQDGQVLDVNSAAARLLGKTRQRLAARPFTDLVDPFDRSKAVLMYRPRPRAVTSWELNLLAADGARLFSFRALPARLARGQGLVVVGSPVRTGAGRGAGPATPVADPALQLLDRAGIAALAVSAEPDLKVTYVSLALSETVLGPGLIRGRPVRELVKDSRLADGCRRALRSRRSIRVQGVGDPVPTSEGDPSFQDLDLHPLLGAEGEPDGVLIMLRDQTEGAHSARELAALLDAATFDEATTMGELAEVALRHLVGLAPDLDFAVALPGSPGSGHPVLASTPGWEDGSEQLIEEVVEAVAEHGGRAELEIRDAHGYATLSAIPLWLRQRPAGPAAAVAWRRPRGRLIQVREEVGIRVVGTRLKAAAEILGLREQLQQTAGSLDAALGMVAVAAEPSGKEITAALQQLGRRLHAVWVAIGQVRDRTFVVRGVWPPEAGTVGPGGRIDTGTEFIVAALRAHEPVTTARLADDLKAVARVPEPINHAIAIPLESDGVLVAARSEADDPALDLTMLKVIEGLAPLALRRSSGEVGDAPPEAGTVMRTRGEQRGGEPLVSVQLEP